MTKKQIMAIVESDEINVRINDVFGLRRYTTDALGNKVDKLFIECGYVSGVKGGRSYEIKARDYSCVMLEIADVMKEYFTECAEKSISGFLSGASI